MPPPSTVSPISSTSPTAPIRRPGGRGKRRGPPPRRWGAPRRHTTPPFFYGGRRHLAGRRRCPSLGTFTIEGAGISPQLQLNWILLDFGRRSSSVERRAQELFQANFAFNRKLQEVAFAVSRNYFSFDASRARVTAARATLESAVVVEEAVGARLEEGLATRPEFLLARQERARAAFELEDARGGVDDAQAALADSLGIAPTALMRVADLSALALPTGLADSVEQIIDRALARRPDLTSRLAALRAREAEERRARAEFWPRLVFSGFAGQALQRYRVGPPFGTFNMNDTEYQAFINFEWKLYDGFERDNALREARSLRGAAEADLSALELKAIREVWKAYSDVKTALRKYEYALALLAASQEAYESTLESYRSAGLATVIDLLAPNATWLAPGPLTSRPALSADRRRLLDVRGGRLIVQM